MKMFTILYAMLFATFAVAGPAQANGQDENTVEKRQSVRRLVPCLRDRRLEDYELTVLGYEQPVCD